MANDFDIAPFGLPNCPEAEARFEEPRDIERVEVVFAAHAPKDAQFQYLRKIWPHERFELLGEQDIHRPSRFGWWQMDDPFNSQWVDAAIVVEQIGASTLRFRFQPLRTEIPDFPDAQQYDVCYRRTLGIRLVAPGAAVRTMRVFTRSAVAKTALRIELDAGRRTPGHELTLAGYNARVRRVRALGGVTVSGAKVELGAGKGRAFRIEVEHMTPAWRYSYDDGLVTFARGKEVFTISLVSLERDGPIWFAEQGVYIARADDPTTFADYRQRIMGSQTVAQQVAARPEQSLAGARNGQPRPHPMPYCFGCTHARQKFWIEPNGDIEMNARVLREVPGKDTGRYRNEGNVRWMFGLERWELEARFHDPWPVLCNNIHVRKGNLRVEQKSFAVPLERSILQGETAADDTMVALVRFRFENTGDVATLAELPVEYCSDAERTVNRRLEMEFPRRTQTDDLVPLCSREKLSVRDGLIMGEFQDGPVIRCGFGNDESPEVTPTGLQFAKELAPGQRWEVLLRIPGIALETDSELTALAGLDFERCYDELRRYWRTEAANSARIRTGVPQLDGLYSGHLPIVLITDVGQPDGSGLVNTSVGTMTYSNYTNESVMILEELDQRGRIEDVRRRLGIWVRYQGTVGLRGNFTDHDGVLFGAGGMEVGHSYNQHHGWALWYLAQHYLMTDDREWFATVAESVVKGAEWIVRQLRQTRGQLPHSHGWERGFLPAGALEDIDDYFYWLSTNCLTWRGLDAAAQALAEFGHTSAPAFRREADAYQQALRRGFETARQHSPLIRLRDGRWIPHYPSRLYCRGRDLGWIREVLEGSLYLILSGLYDPNSKQGKWILDDYLDTRYMNPPFGYYLHDPETQWFDCGGFSVQPNLLAGLLPHLDRDEIEVYLWMFFNAWAACYRQEAGAMVEHPLPTLGFSNATSFKTSDQANAMKWLVYMFVYERQGLLHLGRAIPRVWLAGPGDVFATGIRTSFGEVSVTYRPVAGRNEITADVQLDLRRKPDRLLVRFRHPQGLPIHAVSVNGLPHERFDAQGGDVEIDPANGSIHIAAEYGPPPEDV